MQVATGGFEAYEGPMSHPKCRDTDYIDFLIATPRAASCCEAARSQPPAHNPPATTPTPDCSNGSSPTPRPSTARSSRWSPRPRASWFLDDSTLDELYAKANQPVHRHTRIVREAIRAYRSRPLYRLAPSA